LGEIEEEAKAALVEEVEEAAEQGAEVETGEGQDSRGVEEENV